MYVRSPSKTSIRTGAILAMVLASLLVASLLGLALIETVLVHHRQMHVMGRQQQNFWLAEAGIQRAVRRLAESSDYQGEQWKVSAEVLGAARPAVVTIEVIKDAGSPQARSIRVEARFPGDSVRQGACRRELVVSVPPENPTQ